MKKSYASRSSRRKRVNWKIWTGVLAAIIAAIASIVVAFINKWPPFGVVSATGTLEATSLPPELKIMSVQDGQTVLPRLDSVDGTCNRIPEDQQVWLIVMADNLCYPQDGPAEKLRAGRWEHGPVELLFAAEQQLRAALVSPEAAVELRSAVGREGIRCDRQGVEIIDSVTVKVAPGQSTPTLTPTPAPTAPPTPPLASVEGKVCEIRTEQDRNTVYLRQAEFNSLGLTTSSVVIVVALDTGNSAQNIALDVDASLSTCVVRLSSSLRTTLGLTDDTGIEPPEDRPNRRFNITPSEILVEITSLADGQQVGEQVSRVSGTYKNIPADRELWMVVFVGATYFPQRGPAVILPDGTWNHGSIHFGGIDEFTVYAILVNAQASALFKSQDQFQELPDGVLVLDAVNVYRDQQ